MILSARHAFASVLVGAALLVATSMVRSQAGADPKPAVRDPLDARAPVPPAAHVPAFAGYRPAGETRPIGWKEANETVSRIGGWRAYAREAGAPAPAASGPGGEHRH